MNRIKRSDGGKLKTYHQVVPAMSTPPLRVELSAEEDRTLQDL